VDWASTEVNGIETAEDVLVPEAAKGSDPAAVNVADLATVLVDLDAIDTIVALPQCGKFKIFQSLRFYVKSILEKL